MDNEKKETTEKKMETLDDYEVIIKKIQLQELIDSFNNTVGHLKGKNCPICKNKGVVRVYENGRLLDKECSCMKERRENLRFEASGLAGRLTKNTFKTFQANEYWQQKVKDTAINSMYNGDGFFIGGKCGSGKTHICIAIVQDFLARGVNCKYVGWQELATSLKQNEYGNSDEYVETMTAIKTAPVLFLDDLFRTNVTDADRRLLFSIIDYRYNEVESGKNLFTVFSSEKFLDEIVKIDEGIGRRVARLARGYTLNVPREEKYKYRG